MVLIKIPEMPGIVIDHTSNFTRTPVQQSLGVIDEAYTDFINARGEQRRRNKALKQAMNDDPNWIKIEGERQRVANQRKLIKLHLIHDNSIISSLDAEVRSGKNVLDGKREVLSGHLVTYTKKNGQTVKISGQTFYVKQSAKLEKSK